MGLNIRDMLLGWGEEVAMCESCEEWPCTYHATLLDIILENNPNTEFKDDDNEP